MSPAPSWADAGIEGLLDAFEEAWQRGGRPRIEDFLPPCAVDAADGSAETAHATAAVYRAVLEELVKIDLEYQWRRPSDSLEPPADRPRVEQYAAQFAELGQPDGVGVDLIAEEFRARLRWGDRPSPAEYLARFPRRAGELRGALEAVETELATEFGHSVPASIDRGERETLAESAGDAPIVLPEVADHDILAELGRGGMGVVYKARQVRLNRLVALKMVLAGPHAAPRELARFRAEAEAAARVVHPNIVQIYEVGDCQGRPYVAQELVEGATLASAIAGRPLPPAQAAALVQTLAGAIHAAHRKGIVHRDLKPANILLARTDAGPELDLAAPKISDFGLAKWLDGGPTPAASGRTQTGAILGTPNYMAPEQAEASSEGIGPAADIYALGAILYEALTGRPPFQGLSVLDTLEQVRSCSPIPPGRLQPSVPRDLETICLKCLEKEPRRRYETAEELADDLRRFGQGEPIHARPVPTWERAAKWAGRRPAIAGLAVAFALAVCVLVAGGIIYDLRLRAASRLAEEKRIQAERNFRKAFDAVNRMLMRVGSERLEGVPEMENVRRDLLADAVVYLEGFLAKDGASDPLVREQVGLAYHNLGTIRVRLEKGEQAFADLRRAIDVQSRLVADFPRRATYRQQLGSSRHDLGLIHMGAGRTDAALAEYTEALRLLEPLVPTDPSVRGVLAICYNSLGNLHSEAPGGIDAAYHRKALALREALHREQPSEASADALATSLYNLALYAYSRGRAAEAEPMFSRCVKLWEPIAADRPTGRSFQDNLAECYASLGTLRSGRGPTPESEGLLKKGVAIREQLARQFPHYYRYQDSLGRAYHCLGTCYQGWGRLDEAEAVFAKSVAVREPLVRDRPNDGGLATMLAETCQNRGLTLEGLGRTEEARQNYRKALDVLDRLARASARPTRASQSLGAVCVNYANLLDRQGKRAEGMTYHDRSVELLEAHAHANKETAMANGLLFNARGARAQANEALGRHAEAAADWERVADLAAPANAHTYRFAACMAAARAGLHERAAAMALAFETRETNEAVDFYNLACIRALCEAAVLRDVALPQARREAEAYRHGETALRLLARAKAFLATEDGRKALRTDPDLETLRGRDEFRAIADLATEPSPEVGRTADRQR